MNEDRFWELIENAWAPLGPEAGEARRVLTARSPDTDVFAMPEHSVVEKALDEVTDNLGALARDLTAEELTGLDRVLERLLHDLDRADVHAVTHGSDDGFLYVRGAIVALGRDFYTAVSADPRLAVPGARSESMPYLFAHLHRERFGAFPATGSGVSRESFCNPTGWRT